MNTRRPVHVLLVTSKSAWEQQPFQFKFAATNFKARTNIDGGATDHFDRIDQYSVHRAAIDDFGHANVDDDFQVVP